MGVDSDLWETLTHIRYTCEHVRSPRPIVRDDANRVIFRATPLLRTATPSRVRHSPVPIAPSRLRDSLQSSPYDPSVAHTARREMASKPCTAATTRREQKIAAPTRQQCGSTRSWPQHGARQWSASGRGKLRVASRSLGTFISHSGLCVGHCRAILRSDTAAL